MIIGNGAIAQACKSHDRDDRIYFASGVAQSVGVTHYECRREIALLESMDAGKRLVYFSTLAIFSPKKFYDFWKMAIEAKIKRQFPFYTIIRLGNIEWATNPNQLIPFIRRCLTANIAFPVFDEYRYIVSKDEFQHWLGLIPDFNCEMNITGERIKVADLVERYRRECRVSA